MPTKLMFPDGIRLARKDEISGPEARRSDLWAQVESANITPGFVLAVSQDERFNHYAEINVNAPRIWAVFCDLCQALLGPVASLVLGEIDDELVPVGSVHTSSIITRLEPHKNRLAHDGFLQFGLVSDQDGAISEIFIAPTKHFKVWLNDETGFRLVMERHDLREADHLEFLDQYPRVTIPLPTSAVVVHDPGEFVRHLRNEITAISNGSE